MISRRDVLQAYTALHQAGVVHNDLELRHLRRRTGDGKVRLIDFDRAILVNMEGEGEGAADHHRTSTRLDDAMTMEVDIDIDPRGS